VLGGQWEVKYGMWVNYDADLTTEVPASQPVGQPGVLLEPTCFCTVSCSACVPPPRGGCMHALHGRP
jgi:hypothetical protein